jgi:hypothetical protein
MRQKPPNSAHFARIDYEEDEAGDEYEDFQVWAPEHIIGQFEHDEFDLDRQVHVLE